MPPAQQRRFTAAFDAFFQSERSSSVLVASVVSGLVGYLWLYATSETGGRPS